MSVFHDLQRISVEVNLAIKVHIVERLHWDLIGSSVLELVGLILEGKVVFYRAPGDCGLLVLARTEGRGEVPEANQDRDRCEETEEDAGLESTTDLPGEVCWDDRDERNEEDVGEAFISRTISRQRSILDCWVLRTIISR